MSLSVKVKASAEEKSSIVHTEGEVIRIITEADQEIFRLKGKDLEMAVTNYMGRKPDDIYLCSPTPWGDLFKVYHLPEIKTTLKVKSSKVLEITNDVMIVKKEDYTNDSSVPVKLKTAIEQQVQNTISSSWSTGNGVGIDQSIKYEIVVVKGETKFSYNHSWGTSKSITESVTLKSSSSAEVELQPNQAVLIELKATRGVMKIQVVYEAFLNGTVVLNYGKSFNGHHFYFPSIGDVIKHAGINNSVTATEVIEIEYYFDSQVVIRDKETNQVL